MDKLLTLVRKYPNWGENIDIFERNSPFMLKDDYPCGGYIIPVKKIIHKGE